MLLLAVVNCSYDTTQNGVFHTSPAFSAVAPVHLGHLSLRRTLVQYLIKVVAKLFNAFPARLSNSIVDGDFQTGESCSRTQLATKKSPSNTESLTRKGSGEAAWTLARRWNGNGTYIPAHGFVLADKPLSKQQAVGEHEVDGQPFRIPRESHTCLQAFQNNCGKWELAGTFGAFWQFPVEVEVDELCAKAKQCSNFKR